MSSLKWELSLSIQWKAMQWLREFGSCQLTGLGRRLVCMDKRDARKTPSERHFLRSSHSSEGVKTKTSDDDEEAAAGREKRQLLEDWSDTESVKSDHGPRRGRKRGKSSDLQEQRKSKSHGRERGNGSDTRARNSSHELDDSEAEYYTSQEVSDSDDGELSSLEDLGTGRRVKRRRGKHRAVQPRGRSLSPAGEYRGSSGRLRLRDERGRFIRAGQSAERPRGIQLTRPHKVKVAPSSTKRQKRVEKRPLEFPQNDADTIEASTGEHYRRKRKVQGDAVPSEDGKVTSWDFDSRLRQLLGKVQSTMAPRQEQELMSDRQISDELKQPRGYISEEMISPVSLLRSDRFIKSLQTALPGPAKVVDEEIRSTYTSSINTEAKPRVQNRRDKELWQQEPSSSKLHSRTSSAPQKVRPDSRASSRDNYGSQFPLTSTTMQTSPTYVHVQQSAFESCSHEYRDEETSPPSYNAAMSETGQRPDRNLREQMSRSPLVDARTTDVDSQQIFMKSPGTMRTESPNLTEKQFQPSPVRHRRVSGSDREAEEQISQFRPEGREISGQSLSQSPIRPSSAPSVTDQFQPSPLKSRPMTAASRVPSQMDMESTSFDEKLHEHIRAFQAQQELSPPDSRISSSPIANNPGARSEDWWRGQHLPDPSLVTHSQLSVDLDDLSIKSIDRLSQAVERMASTMEHSENLILSGGQGRAAESGRERGERSRSASPIVFTRPLLRFDVEK
ncbi:hypothetical protein MPTK1_2g04110 [Marchantia polymorpha subsp. ruderalis]